MRNFREREILTVSKTQTSKTRDKTLDKTDERIVSFYDKISSSINTNLRYIAVAIAVACKAGQRGVNRDKMSRVLQNI